jgi:hypothetical protein
VTSSTAQPDRQPSAIADAVRFDEIARLSERAASYSSSIMLAAERGDIHTIRIHCQQVVAISKVVFTTVRELQADEGPRSSQASAALNTTTTPNGQVGEAADVQDQQ